MDDVLAEPEQHVAPLGDALEWFVHNDGDATRVGQVLTGYVGAETRHAHTVVVVGRQQTLVRRLGLSPPRVLQVVARAVRCAVRIRRVAENGVLFRTEGRRDAWRSSVVAQHDLFVLFDQLFVGFHGQVSRTSESVRARATTVPDTNSI